MDNLLDRLAALGNAALGTVVHVGAGTGSVLDVYQRLERDRVLLIEGDTQTGATLQQRALGMPWAEVLVQPVAATAGMLDWHRYSLPALNGPLDAMALARYFPRLRVTGSVPAQALAIAAVLASQQLVADDSRPHVLVLDVPGQEAALLAALPGPLLALFSSVIVRGCRDAMPPGGVAAERAVTKLQVRAFDVEAGSQTGRPLWPVTWLRFNPQRHGLIVAAIQNEQQIAALEATAKQRDQRMAELEAAHAHAGVIIRAKEDRIAELETHLKVASEARDGHAQSNEALEGRVLALSGELDGQTRAAEEAQQRLTVLETTVRLRDQRIAELEAVNFRISAAAHAQQELAAQRQAEVAAALQSRDEYATSIGTLQGQVAALTSELQAHVQASVSRLAAVELEAGRQAAESARRDAQGQARLQGAEARLAERAARLNDLEKTAQDAQERTSSQIEKLRAQVDESRQAAAIALKLQLLRESDLKQLQGRYHETQLRLHDQQELLGKVAQRLSVANHYFLQLSQADGSPVTDERVAAWSLQHPAPHLAMQVASELGGATNEEAVPAPPESRGGDASPRKMAAP